MYLERIKYLDRTERRIAAVTATNRLDALVQAIQEAYNDFKGDINNPSCQVTLFYYKFRQYEIKPGEADHTPPCRTMKEKQTQVKLI